MKSSDTIEMGVCGPPESFEEDDDQAMERLLQEQLQAELAALDRNKRRKKMLDTKVSGGRNKRQKRVLAPEPRNVKPEALKPEVDEETEGDAEDMEEQVEDEAPENTGVPSKIKAERTTHDEVQLLVEWEDYPEEKNWTWELESELAKSVPALVNRWKTRILEDEIATEALHVVEKILAKRKWKGIPHYLVKWQGYEDIKDRTWEPCDRLAVDVPHMVHAYENKKPKKSKK